MTTSPLPRGWPDSAHEKQSDCVVAFPEMASFPASQISGHGWVVAVLDDLIQFTRHQDLRETERALRRTRLEALQELRRQSF